MPNGRHGALPPAPLHTTISQHAVQQVYVIKTREYYSFYYGLISYLKARCIVNAPCLSICGLRQWAVLRVSYSQWAALRIILSVGSAESMMLLACTESMIVSAPPAESMILSALLDSVITLKGLQRRGGGATKKTTIGNTDNRR